jgi:hypothetical protein
MENMTGPQKVIFKATIKFHIQNGMCEQMAIQKGMEKIAQMKRMSNQMAKQGFKF